MAKYMKCQSALATVDVDYQYCCLQLRQIHWPKITYVRRTSEFPYRTKRSRRKKTVRVRTGLRNRDIWPRRVLTSREVGFQNFSVTSVTSVTSVAKIVLAMSFQASCRYKAKRSMQLVQPNWCESRAAADSNSCCRKVISVFAP